MAEGGGLENRRAKAPWVRILPPPPPFEFQEKSPRRDGRVVEGARLLSGCRIKSPTQGSNPCLSANIIDRLSFKILQSPQTLPLS